MLVNIYIYSKYFNIIDAVPNYKYYMATTTLSNTLGLFLLKGF